MSYDEGLAARKAAIASLLLGCCIMGCPASDANIDGPLDSNRRPGDPGIVPQTTVRDEFRPLTQDGTPIEFAELTYSDGNPTHYADGSPAYHADGTPIDYRPRNIQRALEKMPTVFIRDAGQPRLGFEGSQASPGVEYLSLTDESRVLISGDPNLVWTDPTTGDVCWRALTCQNPDCVSHDSEPLIFAASVPGFGTSKARGVSVEDALAPMRCPRCGRRDGVTKYHPPATTSRTEALRVELARIRTERQGK
jgi:hypothetical protein